MNLFDLKSDYQSLRTKKVLLGKEAIEAVKCNGDALQYVKEQSEAICIEAVKEDGYALKYVKEQSEAICIEAVKCNGYALQYVKEQSEAICIEAVKEDGDTLKYVDEIFFIEKEKVFCEIDGVEYSESTLRSMIKKATCTK